MMLAREFFGDSFRSLRAEKLGASLLKLCRDAEHEGDGEKNHKVAKEEKAHVND